MSTIRKLTIFLLAIIVVSMEMMTMVSCGNRNDDCANWEFDSNLNEVGKGKRELRESTSGLFPFPRVGRSGRKPSKSRFLDQIKRREGLIPFPRIGRSGNQPHNELLRQIARYLPFSFQFMRGNNKGPGTGMYYKKNWLADSFKEYNQPLISDANESTEYGDEPFPKSHFLSSDLIDDAENKEATAEHSISE